MTKSERPVIYRIEVFYLDEGLFDSPASENYPLAFVGDPRGLRDFVLEQAGMAPIEDPRWFRAAMYKLGRRLAAETTEELYERERDWGWYERFEDAERVVLENLTDIFESGYYNLARISASRSGVVDIRRAAEERWYQAIYHPDWRAEGRKKDHEVWKIPAPKRLRGHFGIGPYPDAMKK